MAAKLPIREPRRSPRDWRRIGTHWGHCIVGVQIAIILATTIMFRIWRRKINLNYFAPCPGEAAIRNDEPLQHRGDQPDGSGNWLILDEGAEF